MTQQESWQPIKTAPKDGTPILAWSSKVADDEQPQIVWWNETGGYWELAWDCSLWYDKNTPPTHWMPLPAPPTDNGEETRK